MLFNSIDFAIFLPVVFILYWFVFYKNLRLQNLLIVVASYVFYGWWDWRFLSLIFFSTFVDYTVGLRLKNENNQLHRKLLVWTSIVINLGLLGFFKYYNFFVENFVAAFSLFGSPIKANTLDIILPVGISFYTFQTLSYSIDVYKRKLEPTDNFIDFAGFVAFFPQLVAGPIERAKDLLPQFYNKRFFNYAKAVDGMRQILWGLFKKIAIADNCAVYVNDIFDNSADIYGSTLLIGAFLFSFQLYCDFSGYSDIAIGTARLFGFNLKQNFAFPFFSTNLKEFWTKWHISLTSWFRDYLFLPLVKSLPINAFTKVLNVFILFILIGFWHGANWNFILWGVLNATHFSIILFNKKITNKGILRKGILIPNFKEFYSIFFTFGFVALTSIIFRAENVSFAFTYIINMFKNPGSYLSISNYLDYYELINLLGIFFLSEWLGREKQYALSAIDFISSQFIRWFIYMVLIYFIFYEFRTIPQQEFIYFDF